MMKQFVTDALLVFAVVALLVLLWLAVDVLPYHAATPD